MKIFSRDYSACIDSFVRTSKILTHTRKYFGHINILFRTFKAAFWFAKPAMISAMECSRLGWCNSGADAVSCSGCAAQLKHDTGE
jgi:hypothetical protein